MKIKNFQPKIERSKKKGKEKKKSPILKINTFFSKLSQIYKSDPRDTFFPHHVFPRYDRGKKSVELIANPVTRRG